MPDEQHIPQLDALVIGAGMGGLSASISMASRGLRVACLEAGPRAGGKLNIAHHEGIAFDTGPSVLTMPYVLEDLFEEAGARREDYVELLSDEERPHFLYHWPDGQRLEIYFSIEHSLQAVRAQLGAPAAAQLRSFLDYAQEIWEVAAPNFIFGPSPSLGGVVKLGLRKMAQMRKIDPMRSMWKGICAHVDDPYLRDLLARYATYNGSSPYSAPATLNCIAAVELVEGSYGVKGGMYALAQGLERLARERGVEFYYNQRVDRIELDDSGRVRGLRSAQGQRWSAPLIVANADASRVREHLLPASARAPIPTNDEPSMSGWTGVLKARRRADRPAHQVLFPSRDYQAEFDDIFDQRRPPTEPTVYLCAQEKAHQREGWSEHEPLFVMANAPALDPGDRALPDNDYAQLRDRVLQRLREHDLIDPDDALVWSRDPQELAAAFPGSRGSIYGAASNSQFAAFKRPPNRIDGIPGLFLASGSAHPGGGVPLCLQSGRLAATQAAEMLKVSSER